MKTNFALEAEVDGKITEIKNCRICIVGKRPENKPYVSIGVDDETFFISDKDLERFAVNILKALKSKKLK